VTVVKDTETYNNYNWVDSPIFDDDWFGEMPGNDEHIISSGTWEGVTVPDGSPYKDWDIKSTGSLNPFVNAYGALRSAWNSNPLPYISRYNFSYGADITGTLGRPGCKIMSDCYASSSIAEVSVGRHAYEFVA
jgi:hypothetical protein